jgi:hypothetical protein
MTQRIKEQIGILATIEPKSHFVQIGREMLWANPVPRSHNAALEKRESRFNGVCVNVAHDINLATVVDGLVPRSGDSSALHCEGIGCEVIGDNHVYIAAYILADVGQSFPTSHL